MRILASLQAATLPLATVLLLLTTSPALSGVPGQSTVNINIDSTTIETTQVNEIINDVILESLWQILGKTEERDVWGKNPAPPKFWELEVTVSDAEFATALADMKSQLFELTNIPGRKNTYKTLQDEQTGERLDLVVSDYEEVQTGQSTEFSETIDTGGAEWGVDYIGGDPSNYHTWIAIGPNNVNVQVDQVTTTTTFLDAITTNSYNQVATWQISTLRTISPILLDMNGSGSIQASGGNWLPHNELHRERIAFFDFYGDKFPVLMEWPGPEDGILCRPNPDGSIDGTNLFGTATGHKDGFEALRALDQNKDGRLTGAELEGLAVWMDKNSDARPQPGEVFSLQELGITELSLSHKNYVGAFVRDGKTQLMFDWWPQIYELNRIRVIPQNV